MRHGPKIASVAALIGDPARANMLGALMHGCSLTSSELPLEAGVTKQTASAHLAKLHKGGLVAVEAQGRHRYYRLADSDVADLLETLMGVAARAKALRTRPGPAEPALRRARICYDHLAGELGVALFDAFIRNKWLTLSKGDYVLTRLGRAKVESFGVELDYLEAGAERPPSPPRRRARSGAAGANLRTRLGRAAARRITRGGVHQARRSGAEARVRAARRRVSTCHRAHCVLD